MKEKEERYLIDKDTIQNIIKNTESFKDTTKMLDISFYEKGKNLYDLYKYIIRIRKKNDNIKLEIKNYKDESECIEAALKLDNVSSGVEFLKQMNLTPAIYLKRDRTVRKYKDLLIFIDEFDLIGDYVEIEYQDSLNAEKEIEEFKELCNITGEKQDMYGGIINERLKDKEFKKIYEESFNEIIKNI